MSTPGSPLPPRRPPVAGGAAHPPAYPDPGGDADEKTASFDLADLERALKAQHQAPPQPPLQTGSEPSPAVSLDGLPLDVPVPARPAPRQVQRTLVGTPVAPKAVVPAVSPRPARPVSQVPREVASPAADEATQAVDMRAMIASIDADHGAVAASEELVPQPRTSARVAPPAREVATEAQAGVPERVVAPLPRQLDTSAPRAPAQPSPAAAQPSRAAPAPSRVDEAAAPVASPRAAPAATPPRQAPPARPPAEPSPQPPFPAGAVFIDDIDFYLRHVALEAAVARGERPASALDRPRARRGLLNASAVGGALLALTLLAGLIG
jgi:hypothetical protein